MINKCHRRSKCCRSGQNIIRYVYSSSLSSLKAHILDLLQDNSILFDQAISEHRVNACKFSVSFILKKLRGDMRARRYNDCMATIRRLPSVDHNFQLVITKAYEDGDQDLLEDEDESTCTYICFFFLWTQL